MGDEVAVHGALGHGALGHSALARSTAEQCGPTGGQLDHLMDVLEGALSGQPLELPPPTGDPQHDRLRALIAALLPLSPRPAPLRPLLEALDRTHGPRAVARGLGWAVELPPSPPAEVAVDGARLGALLEDIVTCAILVARAHGGVRVHLGPGGGATGREAQLTIEGPGLVMGLPGLLFAEARSMGARLTLPFDRPTCATLDLILAPGSSWAPLPALSPALSSASAPASAPALVPTADRGGRAALRGLRVVAADDHEINRFILSSMLEELGCTGIQAEDGRAALALAQAERPDALILDLYMPALDGLEVARRLRAWEAEAGVPRTPIFALTADASPATAAACKAAGMDAFLVKPADPDAVLAALLAHCAPTAPAPRRATPRAAVQPPQLAADRRRAPEPPASALDQKQVNMMREVMGPAAFAELILTFVAHTAEQIDVLEAALIARDWPAAQRLAHGVKSGTAQMGAIGMSQLARIIEDQLRAQILVDGPATTSALRASLEAARGALSA